MIKNLKTRAKQKLLDITNYSYKNAWIPHSWKTATIIPIPKEGKPLSKLVSYRPISLTSDLSKITERLIENRLRK